MKNAKVLAAVMAASLITGAMPVLPISDYFESNIITASAEPIETQWDRTSLSNAMKSWAISSVVFLDHKPENGTVSTAVSVSSDDTIVAGPANDTSGIMYIWSANGGKVKAPSDCSSLFNGDHSEYIQKNITSIDCSALDTSEVVNMKLMFLKLKALTSLNVSGFDTSNVTDMTGMFFMCDKLAKLDLSSFNTSNVTDMMLLFSGCHALTELDIRGFNTCNVTNMSGMFYECRALASVDVSSFDTHDTTDMTGMFYECKSLTSLDLSSFSTNKVKLFSWFLNGCTSLTYVDMSNFTVMNNADIEEPAINCHALKSVKCSENVYEKFGFDESVKRVSLGLRECFVEGCSLDIDNGAFYLNIYTDFPADYKKYNVQIMLPDGTKTTTEVGKAETIEMGGKTYTVFPANVAAKDIDSNIAVTVTSDSNQEIGTVNLSVSEYAYALKNRNPEYSDFIDAMLNYGGYANAYFRGESYNPALYTQNDFDEIREKCQTAHNSIEDSNYVGTSLLLKNQIILRHYFKAEVTGATKKGDFWYVEKAFNPTQFDEAFGGYNYSIYHYLEKVLDTHSSMTAELKNLCCALYEYNQEALKLVNNN